MSMVYYCYDSPTSTASSAIWTYTYQTQPVGNRQHGGQSPPQHCKDE